MVCPFSLGKETIYLQNNWEVQPKGKFVLDRGEKISRASIEKNYTISTEKKESKNSQ